MKYTSNSIPVKRDLTHCFMPQAGWQYEYVSERSVKIIFIIK